MTKTLTVKEFAEIISEDYPIAMALIKLLEKTEQAKKVGKRPTDTGRGKPSDLFEINSEADFVFWEDNQQADCSQQAGSEAEQESAPAEATEPVAEVVA